MRRILLAFMAIGTIASVHAQTQKKKVDPSTIRSVYSGNFDLVGLDNTCDSIGWPFPENYSSRFYALGPVEGYLTGTNFYDDKAKGNFYDLSATTANFINRAIIGLGFSNGANGGNLTKPVSVKVYDGTANTPGALLGTYASTLGEMNQRQLNFTFVVFPSPIALPPSKKIFLVLEFSGLTWNNTTDAATKDTCGLLSTDLTVQINPPLAWEQWDDDRWFSMFDAWSDPDEDFYLRINNHIYPLVSTTGDGCNTLPVTFGGFTANMTSVGVDLRWQTWTETKSKFFEVERSTDGLKYTAIGTVASKAVNGEHNGLLSYQFTDATPAPGTNLYRIRQVDVDGNSTLSKTVKITNNVQVENSIISNYYPNPVSDRLIIQLGAGIRSVESLRFMDASGRVVSAMRPAVSPEGTINVSTSTLRSGLNFATVTLPGGEQSTIKLMKE